MHSKWILHIARTKDSQQATNFYYALVWHSGYTGNGARMGVLSVFAVAAVVCAHWSIHGMQ